ncbi:MAG: glycine--tRNA ligase subunit beta, partial [Rhodospirillales bacterium]
MPELLLEILSEEIPARMQARAADDLKRLVTDGLKAAGLDFRKAEAYVTPRRLCLVVDGLPEKQPDVSEERRGPKVDAPEQAVAGFRKSLPEGAVIEQRETPKGTFFFALVDIKGAWTSQVIAIVFYKLLITFPWPKSMRWSSGGMRWVRPITQIMMTFGGQRFDVPILLGVHVGPNGNTISPLLPEDSTVGHRFLAPDAFEVKDFADYKAKLLNAKVMLDPAERRAKIEADAKALAAKEGLSLKDDPGLLDEVTGLVEWPVVLMGTIEQQFMTLPAEVLTTSMRAHQKYFACLNADGTLANKFIVVANTETKDGGKQVVAGNERVLRARLSDAKFFWDQDRAQTLESRVDALKDRVFHAKLGNLLEKVDRVEVLAAEIAAHVPGADKDKVKRAARLAKADLSTGMVGEFPELQGLMGRYYAIADGEDAAVCDAIAEHYSPLGPNDTCPTHPVSVCVALADKIDTLVGFFGIEQFPTGSKDPYALRRAALGVIRIILENQLRFALKDVINKLIPAFMLSVESTVESSVERPIRGISAETAEWVMIFLADRLKVHLREQGVRHDLIDAVFALGGEDDLVRLIKRVEALQSFLA